MNSSWPMFHHDPQHTGRSLYGPIGNWPLVKWKFRMDGLTVSSPAIDENSTIYIGAEGFYDKFFFAINPNGSEKWHFNPSDWVDSSPVLSSDGIVYFGSHNHYLQALWPNGCLICRIGCFLHQPLEPTGQFMLVLLTIIFMR
jgi:hypothetical protein